jgi:hypothetical protein
MNSIIPSLLLVCVTLAGLNGCAGYRVGNIQGAEMAGVKTIYVPMAKNQSLESGMPGMVTQAVLRRIDNDGTYRSGRSGEADAVLEITVVQVRREPLRSSRSNVVLTEEYELVIEAEATLTNLKSGQRIFQNKIVTGKTAYYAQNNLQESERQAIPLAADNLAYNIVKLAAEGW